MLCSIRTFRAHYQDAILVPGIPALRKAAQMDVWKRRVRYKPTVSPPARKIGPRHGDGRKVERVEIAAITGFGGVRGRSRSQFERQRSARRWYPDYWQWRAEMRAWGA